MEKIIDFQGFNVAVVKRLYDNDSTLCDLIQKEVDENGEITDSVVKYESDFIFHKDNSPFVLTDEDVLELRPPVIESAFNK